MCPSPRGYICEAGYLPKLLASLPMFHDPEYDLSSESLPDLCFTSSSSPATSGEDDATSMTTSQDDFDDLDTSSVDSYQISKPLITPVSEFGRRTLYYIKEYAPLLDSCNMVSSDWARVARDIVDNYEQFDAFVVLHGTDTMAYTASALSFMLENLCKTVVVTGSQIPLCRPRNDGVANLLGSLAVAGHFDIPEVTLFFGSRLLRGCRASKVNASSLEGAFNAPNSTPLGQVGIGIDVKWNLVKHVPHHGLCFRPGFSNNVSILRIYPGQFTTLAQSIAPPLKGLILQTFGAGNGPDQDVYFLSTLKAASARGLVVVNVTQCHRGCVEAHYATGTALAEAGVVSGLDMTCEAALIKLGWLLSRYPGDPMQVRKMMTVDMRGELTEPSNQNSVSNEAKKGKSTLGYESCGFLDVVFNALQDANMIGHTQGIIDNNTDNNTEINNTDNNTVNDELSAMDDIQKALLPTLMCAAAAQGLTEDLSSMMFSDTGGTGKTNSAQCAREGDYDKRTPLHLAASEGQVDTVRFLLSLKVDKVGDKVGDKEGEKEEEQFVDVSAIDRFGTSPLQNALDGGHEDCIRLLAEAGAGMHHMTSSQLAVRLNTLVMEKNVAKLKLHVVDARIDVNCHDYDKRTPLHIAAAEGREDCVDLLMRGGGNPNFKDRWECSPLDEAKKNGHDALVQRMSQ